MSSQALIDEFSRRLESDFKLRPVTASEIEFYLPGMPPDSRDWLGKEVTAACARAAIPIYKIEKERGADQYEISLRPASPVATARDTEILKTLVSEAASQLNMAADFSPKPFANQPGSGLHIHIHLEEVSGKNVFYKDDARMSDALKFSLGGLLAWLPDGMAVFAPHESSYARFAPGGNAPATVSWGANNRTVAVRLPDSEHDNKRIEHRVSGADADAGAVMAVLLAAVYDGLKQRTEPGPQIYGDAALPQYGLQKLPATLEEACARLLSSKRLSEYFTASELLPGRL